MKDKIRLGFVGYGLRGYMVNNCAEHKDVNLVAVCDLNPERVERMQEAVEKITGRRPYGSTNHKDLIANSALDAVIICTSWSSHIPLSIDFMNAGIAVGCEVGGCDNIHQLWQLVETHRRTGTEFMMLENCCYGRYEMMILNMVKQGLFGDVVHCEGGYHHYLCDEIANGKNYRLKNYLHRNCDNYPTHALGPIAKILGINHGNRFVSLSSVSSKASGLKSYMLNNGTYGGESFCQGDVVSTHICCANGETIHLSLATSTPVLSSRRFNIFGTKAFYHQDTNSIGTCKDLAALEGPWKPNWNNAEAYLEQYDHPVWKQYIKSGIKGSHNGMDYLVISAFIDSVKNGTKPPIDVYDAAALMAVTPLSEQSVSMGGTPVSFPDFTYGQWIEDEGAK